MNAGNIEELIHEAAARFPERIALSGGGSSLSHAELEARSNSLANFLIRSGAVPGAVVVILTQDIPLSIVAILGVLKAGCVFVPLDPSTPVRRLAAMLADLDPQWCLTDEQFFSLLSGMALEAGLTPRTIDLTRDLPGANGDAEQAGVVVDSEWADSSYPGLAHNPEQMAYVYYTSGSTGKPKGIAGRLKGIDHFIRWQIETLGLDETERVSQLLPLSFDGSLRDIFIPLATGGCICVPPTREVLLEPAQLVKWLEQDEVTVMHCVPSLWRTLINTGLSAEQLPQLRYVVMAGEAVLVADVARWQAVFGERIELINLYGTSETTMAKFWHRIVAADCERPSIPIGKPISGARALILDERGRVCPVGTVGEIYIRTPYRALGYYRQEEMTKAVFVQNPFSTDPDDIVYRTGDLGRILEDGNYEYLGRRDQQVKVRGVRVELGEVENVLREHGGVRDVAVVDREDGSGNNYLCAYVVVAEGVESGELREYAQGMLPAYMVPGSYIEMEKLPRTLSGKIDRRALPTLDEARRDSNFEYILPQTAVEEVMSGIWRGVLGLGRISTRDNFFELGGHSLLATQVMSRVREAFQIELPLTSLFDAPTVEQLSLIVAMNEAKPGQAEKIAQVLKKIDSMSDADVKQTLASKETVRENA